jgi:uncharacterized protein YbcV (DUF1398 family)
MMKDWKEIARATLAGAEDDTMTFPESVRMLMEGGFDGYAVDFRHGTRTYYRPDGEALALQTAPVSVPVAERFDTAVVKDAASASSITAARARFTPSIFPARNLRRNVCANAGLAPPAAPDPALGCAQTPNLRSRTRQGF